MKNLIYFLIACAVHICIHQIAYHYGLISDDANATLLFLALFAIFAVGISANSETNNSTL